MRNGQVRDSDIDLPLPRRRARAKVNFDAVLDAILAVGLIAMVVGYFWLVWSWGK